MTTKYPTLADLQNTLQNAQTQHRKAQNGRSIKVVKDFNVLFLSMLVKTYRENIKLAQPFLAAGPVADITTKAADIFSNAVFIHLEVTPENGRPFMLRIKHSQGKGKIKDHTSELMQLEKIGYVNGGAARLSYSSTFTDAIPDLRIHDRPAPLTWRKAIKRSAALAS